MLSTLAAKIRALQAEAKANFNTNTLYFLDAPHMDHLGFKVKVLGSNKQQQKSLTRLKNSVFYHDIVHASSLVDDKLLQIQSLIDNFVEHKLDLKVHLCSADLIMKDKDSAAYLRLLEINSFLAQQSKLKNSIYFLNALKATLQLYPLAYFLSEQNFNSEDLNLEHESCQNFNPKQKEQIRALSQLLDTKHQGCNFIQQVAQLTRALCLQSDIGMIYACSLLGLEQILQAYQSLKRFEPELTIESMIAKLAQLYSNDHKATILRLHEFLSSTSYKSFKLSKDNQIERYDFLSQSANKTPKQLSIKAKHKTLVLTNVATNAHAIIDDSCSKEDFSSITLSPTELNTSLFNSNNIQLKQSLILETATNSQISASEQSFSSFKEASKGNDPVTTAHKDKTTATVTQKSNKTPTSKAKSLVLTNAASSESSLFVTASQQDKQTAVAVKKSNNAPANKSKAKGLVITNAVSSESSLFVTAAHQQMKQLSSQEPSVTAKEPAPANLQSESTSIVRELAVSTIQDRPATTANQKSNKLPDSKAKGLVLTNVASSESSLSVTKVNQQIEQISYQEPSVTAKETAHANLQSESTSIVSDLVVSTNKYKPTAVAVKKNTTAPAPKTTAKALALTNAAPLAVKTPIDLESKQELTDIHHNDKSNLLQQPTSAGVVSNDVIDTDTNNTELLANYDSDSPALKHDLSTSLDAADEKSNLELNKGIATNSTVSKEVITNPPKQRKLKRQLSAINKSSKKSPNLTLDKKPLANSEEQITTKLNLDSKAQAKGDNAVLNSNTVTSKPSIYETAQDELNLTKIATKDSEVKGAELSSKKLHSDNTYGRWHRLSTRNISASNHLNPGFMNSKDNAQNNDSLIAKSFTNQELSFDPITGTYIYEDQSNSTGEPNTYESNNLDFNTESFDDDFMQDLMAHQATDFLDNTESNATELDWDKLLECDDELMRLKYIMLYAQSMLLNQQQYKALLKPSSFSSYIPLRQALSSLKTLENYKETMVYLLSNHNSAMAVLNQHLSKFKYYRRTLGTTWQMSANNPKGPYSAKDKASFEQLNSSSSINFILACLLLCGSNILQLSNECLLESAYSACQIECPI